MNEPTRKLLNLLAGRNGAYSNVLQAIVRTSDDVRAQVELQLALTVEERNRALAGQDEDKADTLGHKIEAFENILGRTEL